MYRFGSENLHICEPDNSKLNADIRSVSIECKAPEKKTHLSINKGPIEINWYQGDINTFAFHVNGVYKNSISFNVKHFTVGYCISIEIKTVEFLFDFFSCM